MKVILRTEIGKQKCEISERAVSELCAQHIKQETAFNGLETEVAIQRGFL